MHTESQMHDALLNYLEESGSWAAATAFAGKYFGDQGTKFVTCLKHDGRWIAVQWVTTSSKLLGAAPRVSPGRVAISRRRQRAMRKMVHARWLADVKEPEGFSVGVQIYARLGNR